MQTIPANVNEWSKLFHDGKVDENTISVAVSLSELKLIMKMASHFWLANSMTMANENLRQLEKLQDDVQKLLNHMGK